MWSDHIDRYNESLRRINSTAAAVTENITRTMCRSDESIRIENLYVQGIHKTDPGYRKVVDNHETLGAQSRITSRTMTETEYNLLLGMEREEIIRHFAILHER